MSPADKIKLTNMIDQSVNHALSMMNLVDSETAMQHFEKVCASIVYHSNQEDVEDITNVLQEFLVKKSKKLNVTRDYTDEQKE